MTQRGARLSLCYQPATVWLLLSPQDAKAKCERKCEGELSRKRIKEGRGQDRVLGEVTASSLVGLPQSLQGACPVYLCKKDQEEGTGDSLSGAGESKEETVKAAAHRCKEQGNSLLSP